MSAPNDKTTQVGAADQPEHGTRNPARRKALLGISTLVIVAGIAYGVYWALMLNHYESTDDAYVQGNVVQITPQIAGTVIAINADDTDYVEAGTVLIKLDKADAQVALEQAEAQLAQTVREVSATFANNSTLKAQIAVRQADLVRAESEESRARDDVRRRAPLARSGAVGSEEINHSKAALANARSSVIAARAAVLAAREQLAANQTLTQGTAVDQHPSVRQAAARVRQAYLALERTELRSPVSGYVARRNVQLGQRIAPGAPLISVVPLDKLWVDANFKESQLAELRIDQPVTLESDLYGNKVEYHGKIQGMAAGTGAAFSLLPAQNASGNWIKIVQRVPVRIQLDPDALARHPLRVGLSMTARVDVSDIGGPVLTVGSHADSKLRMPAVDADNAVVQARVREIISANGGPVRADGNQTVALSIDAIARSGDRGDPAAAALNR